MGATHTIATGGQITGVAANPSTIEENFMLSLQESVTPSDSGEFHIWNYNIPILSSNEKGVLLEIVGG